MINYIEKGIGLHKNLTSLGLSIADRAGVWVNREGRDAEVNAAIIAYSLTDTQNDIAAQIDAYGTTLREKALKGASPYEMVSWPLKKLEADKIKKGGTSLDAPGLQAEATKRGVTLQAIVDRVTANADILIALEAEIGGNAGKHKDAVRATTTFADALAYDWSGGWPSV